MWDAEFLSGLIGDVYDAALDPALWPLALEQSAKFVGGSAAGIYSKDSFSKTADIDPNYGVGVDVAQQRRYMEHYAKIDPTTTGYFNFGVGEVIATGDVISYDEFVETRFYKEWVKPLGWVDAASSVLEKAGTAYSIFSVFRHERDGLVDDACRGRMQLLAPHIRRAVLIAKTTKLRTAEADALAEALDEIAAAVFLVGPTGRLEHANARGYAMLAEEGIVRSVGGRLIWNDAAAEQVMHEAFAAAETGDSNFGTRAIAVPLNPNGRPYVAHMLPLTSGARRMAGSRCSAVAAVFVRKVELDAPSAPEAIAKLYGLTPGELRVLLAVFESGGVPNVADALGISEATVKTHLRRLFEKTRTERQADLVKLVAGFTVPAA